MESVYDRVKIMYQLYTELVRPVSGGSPYELDERKILGERKVSAYGRTGKEKSNG